MVTAKLRQIWGNSMRTRTPKLKQTTGVGNEWKPWLNSPSQVMVTMKSRRWVLSKPSVWSMNRREHHQFVRKSQRRRLMSRNLILLLRKIYQYYRTSQSRHLLNYTQYSTLIKIVTTSRHRKVKAQEWLRFSIQPAKFLISRKSLMTIQSTGWPTWSKLSSNFQPMTETSICHMNNWSRYARSCSTRTIWRTRNQHMRG